MGIIFENKDKVVEKGYIHAYKEHIFRDQFVLSEEDFKLPENLLNRYLSGLRRQIQIYQKDANGNVTPLTEMDDELLLKLFDAATEQLNSKVDQRVITAFKQERAIARSSVQTIGEQEMNKQEFDRFMRSIQGALSLINQRPRWWSGFARYYYGLLNNIKRHNITSEDEISASFKSNTPWFYTKEKLEADQRIYQSILKSLEQIAYMTLNARENSPSFRSLSSSLNTILDKVIGERIVGVQEKVLFKLDQDVPDWIDKDVQEAIGKKGSLYMKGTKKTVSGDAGERITTKVDTSYRNGNLLISGKTIGQNDYDYLIHGELNSSIKWYKEQKRMIEGIQAMENFSIHSASNYIRELDKVLAKGKQRYAAYNTLAFNDRYSYITSQYWRRIDRFHDAGQGISDDEIANNFRLIRTALIRSLIDVYLAGSGAKISGGGLDLNAFLVVNGRFYSIPRVLQGIIESISKANLTGSAGKDIVYANYDFSKISVVNGVGWEGGRPNLEDAYTRSNKTLALLNKIQVSIKIDSKQMIRYVQSGKVAPDI